MDKYQTLHDFLYLRLEGNCHWGLMTLGSSILDVFHSTGILSTQAQVREVLQNTRQLTCTGLQHPGADAFWACRLALVEFFQVSSNLFIDHHWMLECVHLSRVVACLCLRGGLTGGLEARREANHEVGWSSGPCRQGREQLGFWC